MTSEGPTGSSEQLGDFGARFERAGRESGLCRLNKHHGGGSVSVSGGLSMLSSVVDK